MMKGLILAMSGLIIIIVCTSTLDSQYIGLIIGATLLSLGTLFIGMRWSNQQKPKIIIRSHPIRDTMIIWRKTSLKMDLKDAIRPLIIKGWSNTRIVHYILTKTQDDLKGRFILGDLLKRIASSVRHERSRIS